MKYVYCHRFVVPRSIALTMYVVFFFVGEGGGGGVAVRHLLIITVRLYIANIKRRLCKQQGENKIVIIAAIRIPQSVLTTLFFIKAQGLESAEFSLRTRPDRQIVLKVQLLLANWRFMWDDQNVKKSLQTLLQWNLCPLIFTFLHDFSLSILFS